jgi:recombination endonuclease VII
VPKKRRREGPAAKRHRAFVRAHRIHYDALLEFQGGICAICKQAPVEDRRFDMDHNHRTMTMRGLLCSRCNRFGVEDWMTPEWAYALGEYLEDPPFAQLMRTQW